MKRKDLDHEISSLLLGELNTQEEFNLKERILAEDGSLERIESVRREDEAFLARFPVSVAAAQIESKLRKNSYKENLKTENQHRGKTMMNIKTVSIATVVLACAGFALSQNGDLNSDEKNKAKISSVQSARIAPVKKVVKVKGFAQEFSELKALANSAEEDSKKKDAYRKFAEKYKLDERPDELIWVYDRYASLLEKHEQKGEPSSALMREQIVEKYEAMSVDERRDLIISEDAIARSLFQVSQVDFLEMTALSLNVSDEKMLKANLHKKQALAASIEKNMRILISLGLPTWTVAAHYRNATTYADSAEAVRRSFVPPRLNDSQKIAYHNVLEKSAVKIDMTAIKEVENALSLNEEESPYTNESRILLGRLRGKICPSEKEMESLHRMISEIEGGRLEKARVLVDELGKRSELHFEELLSFRRKVAGKNSVAELRVEAEAIRFQMDEWPCLTRKMHEKFHQIEELEMEPEKREVEESVGSKKEMANRALQFFSRGNFSEAIRFCEQAKGGGKCNRILAISYKRIGKIEKSCKYHKKAKLPLKGMDCSEYE